MPDFGVSSLVGIIDGVKVLAFAVQEGSVAVHCHAGLGRTGMNTVNVHSVRACAYVILWSMVAHVSLLHRCPDSLLPGLHPAYQPE